MTNIQISAIGNFLQYYYTDLIYIKQFQEFKENKVSFHDYIQKEVGTFYSFLIEFRVVRNFESDCIDKLLKATMEFISTKKVDNVDLFVEKLLKTKLTKGKRTTSLASKILFLNNPWKIIPMDTQGRKAFNQKENKYSIYLDNLNSYRVSNKKVIIDCLKYTKPLTDLVHLDFENNLQDLDIICENRMIDKLLWMLGK